MTTHNPLSSNPIRDYFENNRVPSPIVVGGLGGSGTRLVAGLLREMTVNMGEHVNISEDAMHFVELYSGFIAPYLRDRSMPIPRFQERLLSAIQAHRLSMTDEAWGWKNPRSMHLLPILDQCIPNLNYIHVIRHGFEMASSSNTNQLEQYQTHLLDAEQTALPLELRALLFWEAANQSAADYGLSHMGDRYCLLRFEDICTDAASAMQPIAERLELPLPERWKEQIVMPRERRKSMNPEWLERLRTIGAAALERFGYPC